MEKRSTKVKDLEVNKFSRYGIEFVAKKDQCQLVDALDEQKAQKKAIFGKGFLLSRTPRSRTPRSRT